MTPLPQSLMTTPRLDRWVRFNADRTVTVFSGKVELGQGIETAIAQIAADELDVNLEADDGFHRPAHGIGFRVCQSAVAS